MKRIGLFGGTFNPIHCGHLKATLEVKDAFALDRICLIPSALPPHKTRTPVAAARHRLEMTRLAVRGRSEFVISDIELKRSGPSYTIDTARLFQSTDNNHARHYLIMGLDAFLEIDSWKSYDALLRTIPVIVMSRPGAALGDLERTVSDYLHGCIAKGYKFSKADTCFRHNNRRTVYITQVSAIDIASTHIRRLVKGGASIHELVPPEVEQYIQSKGLYQ